MGLDVGGKTIGVAISDELAWTAHGVEVVRRTTFKEDIARLKYLIEENDVQVLVVGLPKNMNGSIGPQGKMAMEFGQKLQRLFNLPVIFWDERLTTVAAQKTLIEADMSRKKRKRVVDKLAAVFILQNYLDSCEKTMS